MAMGVNVSQTGNHPVYLAALRAKNLQNIKSLHYRIL